jgi:hypothetical protein
MKTYLLLPLIATVGCAQVQSRPPEPPTPVTQSMPPAERYPDSTRQAENQRLYGPAGLSLIGPDIAQKIVDRFRTAYGSPSAPRIVVYVNRELVDTTAGMKLTGHTEKYEKTESKQERDMTSPVLVGGTPQTQVNVTVGANPAANPDAVGKGTASHTTTTTSGENTYKVSDAPGATLADRQTVREVERLFGRAFRSAGAQLVDQKVAASLIPDEAGHRLIGDQAAKDRSALNQIADIAIEVLISNRNLTVPEVSGDTTYSVPDIQATAIRLKDSAIVGQASASDVLGKDRTAGRIVRQFDVRDITEATALALMDDMLTGRK